MAKYKLDLCIFYSGYRSRAMPFSQLCNDSKFRSFCQRAKTLYALCHRSRLYCPEIEFVNRDLKILFREENRYLIAFLRHDDNRISYKIGENNLFKVFFTEYKIDQIQSILEYAASFIEGGVHELE